MTTIASLAPQKITVITDEKGEIVAAHHGEPVTADTSKITHLTHPQGGVMAGPGQRLQVISATPEILRATTGEALEAAIKPHLK